MKAEQASARRLARHTRPLDEIAAEIQSQWRTLSFAAVGPVAAMRHLRDIDDAYGSRAGRAVVRDFLGSATSWRGPAARRIKAELKNLLDEPL